MQFCVGLGTSFITLEIVTAIRFKKVIVLKRNKTEGYLYVKMGVKVEWWGLRKCKVSVGRCYQRVKQARESCITRASPHATCASLPSLSSPTLEQATALCIPSYTRHQVHCLAITHPITIVIVKYFNVYLTSSVLFENANFSYFHPRVLVAKRYLVFFIKQFFYIKGLGAIPRGNERLFQKLLYFLKFVLKSPI